MHARIVGARRVLHAFNNAEASRSCTYLTNNYTNRAA